MLGSRKTRTLPNTFPLLKSKFITVLSLETKGVCVLDPFGKTKCFRDKVDFQTCLLCQLYWIRGLLYRLILDFESYAKLTVADMIEKILKRKLTVEERELAIKLASEGKTLTEIIKELETK